MKNIAFIMILSILPLVGFAQALEGMAKQTTHSDKSVASVSEGIEFFGGDWEALLAKAKKDKKPFFVDTYTSWCGPCKMMSKLTFTDAEVAKLANQYFIPYKIDAEKGEGVEIANEYKVHAYPTILFFDAKGNKIGKEVGYMDAEKFVYVMEKYLKKTSK